MVLCYTDTKDTKAGWYMIHVQVIAARLVQLGLANLLLATAVSPSAGSTLVQVRSGMCCDNCCNDAGSISIPCLPEPAAR
jgi:hypothetical protein